MPGHDEEGRTLGIDHGSREDPPLGIVRAPHVDVLAPGTRRAQPGRPERPGAAVGQTVLAVGVVDVHRVVKGRDHDGVEGSLDGRRGGTRPRVDAELGYVEGLRHHLPVDKQGPEPAEGLGLDVRRGEHRLGRVQSGAGVVVVLGEDVQGVGGSGDGQQEEEIRDRETAGSAAHHVVSVNRKNIGRAPRLVNAGCVLFSRNIEDIAVGKFS
jgi:hypothetical protein